MEKILLDFNLIKTQEQVQDYLALQFDFPEHYGKNLDALYDMLTERTADTCVGIFGTDREEDALSSYLKRVKKVFRDAEADNEHLCVIFSNLEENYEEEELL